MIICTKSVDALVRRSFGKEVIMVYGVDTVIAGFALDPTVSSQSPVDLYIVGESDIEKKKKMAAFIEAAGKKHPNVKIIVITRQHSSFTGCVGVNRVLSNPKVDQLIEEVSLIIEGSSTKTVELSTKASIPEYAPEVSADTAQIKEEESKSEATVEEKELEIQEEPGASFTLEHVVTDEEAMESITQRIKDCNSFADIQVLTAELSAQEMVNEIMRDTSSYVAMEERVSALKQHVYSILLDETIPDFGDRVAKVAALSLDKGYYAAQATTIVESHFYEILKLLGQKMKEFTAKEVDKCNKIILSYKNSEVKEFKDFPRLSVILNKRTNILLDIACTKGEIVNIVENMKKFTIEVEQHVIRENTELTGVPSVDNQMTARGSNVTTADGLAVIKKVLEDACNSSTELEECQQCLEILSKQINVVLELDNDIINAQNEIIKYLSANRIEDTVIKNSFIKKAQRIYVGSEGVGRSIISYMISAYRARQNANVLYVDLTGQSKLSDYGISSLSLEEWMESPVEEQFCVVTSDSDIMAKSVSILERLVLLLERAADYYRVISIIASPEQKEVLDLLAANTLSINYITDMYSSNLDATRELIANTNYDNVARKVIVNKCAGCNEKLVERLGLRDVLRMRYDTVPHIEEIVQASLQGVDPTRVSSIEKYFTEVI